MRYGTINCEFWVEEAMRIDELCGNGVGNALLNYLRTNQFTNMLGVYHIAKETMCRRVNLGDDNVLRAFDILCINGYIMYDERYQYVWVVDLAFEQTFPGEDKKDYCNLRLAEKDNRVKAMNEVLTSLPKLSFTKDLINKYQSVMWFKKDSIAKFVNIEGASEGGCQAPCQAPSEGGKEGGVEGAYEASNTVNSKHINNNTDISNDISRAASSTKSKPVPKKRKPKFSQKELEIGAEIVQFLVDTTKKKFGLIESHYEQIAKRVRDGVSVDDMKKVITFKSRKWLHLPGFSDNLNPATLFRDSNFHKYLDEANGEGDFIEKPRALREQEMTEQEKHDRNMLEIYNRFKDDD